MDEVTSISPNSGLIQPTGPQSPDAGRGAPETGRGGESFDVVLREQLLQQQQPAPAPVRFSTHAQHRLQQRDIKLDDAEVAKISQAVDRAQEKGAKESLILLDDMAFVVSVKNRVVITAVDQPSMKQNVFTNIDSVVIA